jgi:hypothetical protein
VRENQLTNQQVILLFFSSFLSGLYKKKGLHRKLGEDLLSCQDQGGSKRRRFKFRRAMPQLREGKLDPPCPILIIN